MTKDKHSTSKNTLSPLNYAQVISSLLTLIPQGWGFTPSQAHDELNTGKNVRLTKRCS